MDETILFPSPNWFLVSNLAVSKDGWLIYGGPSKSLCVLVPLDANSNHVVVGNQGYQAHIVNRAHTEKIVSVDISPEWLEKRFFITGSADGLVKQWTIEKIEKSLKIKSTLSHEIHHNDKEEVVGVGYSTEACAITVGCYGNIVKWDLNSNVVKTYNSFLKNFKPVCMSCSHHAPLNVAVGTKQGVIFVLDLNGSGKIVYKVRGQDDEVMNISWCPQYDVSVKKTLQQSEKRSFLADRLEAIRNEPEPENVLEASGIIKKLPEDSFDEPVVPEDDMFDIYKDHEVDEFGHKKYQPEDIVVKVKEEDTKDDDYLAECMKLKDEILKRKNQTEESIQSLVEALDNTHVNTQSTSSMPGETSSTQAETEEKKTKDTTVESSGHTHKHLLATVGKYGGVRIWSKSGKLVGSCAVPSSGKNPRSKVQSWPTILWYKPDALLIADGKSQLLECNPLQIDCKNKLEWRLVHSHHKRGLYCIASNAPRIQTEEQMSEYWPIWTVSQERTIVNYCMKNKQKLATYYTCGGFLYDVQSCPYDANKVAVSVGDGAVRVWESTTQPEDDSKVTPGNVHTYWQNVQGKVLTVAWHPTKENVLAFATAESRVGTLDTSGRSERPARVLQSAVSGGVYSLCWGEGNDLYASGGGELVRYHTDRPDEAPAPVRVELEGSRWQLSAVHWTAWGLLCGSCSGAIALLTLDSHQLVAVAFVFTKMIHTIEWHPQETSSSNEESAYKNLIAVCALDKESTIAILEYGSKEDGTIQLSEWKRLPGHKAPVLQVSWNPHRDAQLLSTSQDSTVRIWNVAEGVCTSIFGGHTQASLGATWSPRPRLADYVLSGGSDSCLRLWNIAHHPASEYIETKHETMTKKKKGKDKKETAKHDTETTETDEQVATSLDTKIKGSKKFLLPITYKQMYPCNVQGIRRMFKIYVEKSPVEDGDTTEYDLDYIKMFGGINDVNELLDKEMDRHLQVGNTENWLILSIFRGHIDATIQFANQRDLLCPYLVSIAPCVSLKYWKDVTQLYVAQIDRLVAKGEDDKLNVNKTYGGPVYRKAATLLSIHDVKGAVAVLTEAHLFKEAYLLCRTRHMDSIAEETLKQWAQYCVTSGLFNLASVCYIALGELSQAASILAKSNNQEQLCLAADLAKFTGQTTFADHVEKKAQTIQKPVDTEELLEQLPSRIELIMKDDKTENGVINGDKVDCDSVNN